MKDNCLATTCRHRPGRKFAERQIFSILVSFRGRVETPLHQAIWALGFEIANGADQGAEDDRFPKITACV